MTTDNIPGLLHVLCIVTAGITLAVTIVMWLELAFTDHGKPWLAVALTMVFIISIVYVIDSETKWQRTLARIRECKETEDDS